MAHDLPQLMAWRQPASQARRVGAPAHRAVPWAVARAVPGNAQKRARLVTFPLPLGITCGTPAERHEAGGGRLQRERTLCEALHQHRREAWCVGLVLAPHDDILNGAHPGGCPLQPWLHAPRDPQGQHGMQGEGAQDNAARASLGDPFLTRLDETVFQLPGLQPPSDQP